MKKYIVIFIIVVLTLYGCLYGCKELFKINTSCDETACRK